MVARRSYSTPEASGSSQEELPHVQGALVAWAQEAESSHSMFKVSKGVGEEIPLIQGKE